MLRTIFTLGVILVAAVTALSACGGPEPQSLQFGEAVWSAGERSVYRITDLNGAYAGTVEYAFTTPDAQTWRLARVIDAQGDVERFTVDMEAAGFRPVASELQRENSDGLEKVLAKYDKGVVNLELTTKQDVTTYQRLTVPSDTRDARALFMLLRALPLADRYATRVNTVLPVASQMARVGVEVKGQDEVTTPAGVFTAWEVELDEGERKSRAWISTEAPYPLVKFEDAANGGLFELAEFAAGE